MRSPTGDRSASAPRRRRGARSGDRGASFIELVVAVTLTGLMVVPLMATLRASIKASAVNEAAAVAETVIVDAADRINRAPLSCDYTVYAQAAVQIRGWDPTRATVTHEHYDTDLDSWQPGGCELALPTESLVQRVGITIRTPSGGVTRAIEVVKSNV